MGRVHGRRPRDRGRRCQAGGTAAAAVALVIIGSIQGFAAAAQPAAAATIEVAGAPARGPADSPVTIVMFTDFSNPAYGSTGVVLQGLLDMYPERLRIVFKHTLPPKQPARLLVHAAARAAGEQGKFWEMHDLLLANQAHQTRADLLGMAAQLQLDVARFTADLDSGKYQPVVEADQQQAEALGITGQPTWFVNGTRLRGPVTFLELQRLIDGFLK